MLLSVALLVPTAGTDGSCATTTVDLDELSQMCDEAKSGYTAVKPDAVETARKDAVAAVKKVDRHLQSLPADQQQEWRDHLKWDIVQTAILDTDAPSVDQLKPVVAPYVRGDKDGMEAAVFQSARKAIFAYYDAVRFTQEGFQQQFDVHVDGILKDLTAYQTKPSDDLAWQLGYRLEFLDRTEQAPELVTAIRDSLWQPNIFVMASEDVIGAGIGREVDEVEPVNEVVYGTSIVGTAQVNGDVSFDLVPSKKDLTFDILMAATAQTSNVGYRGRVAVYSSGMSDINANARLSFDFAKLVAGTADATVASSSTITGVAANCKAVRKIAWNQAQKQSPVVTEIMSGRSATRVARRFDAEVSEIVAKANRDYNKKVKAPLERREAFPRELKVASTEKHLTLSAMQVASSQVAAPASPPQLDGKFDLAVRVHESLAANVGETAIGGQTLTDEKLVEILEEQGQDVPEELKITSDKDPWSITFSPRRPVRVKFDANTIRVAIRGIRFTRGDQAPLQRAIEISAVYQIKEGDTGIHLVRDGDVEVDFYKGMFQLKMESLGIREVTYKTFVRKKFAAMFKDEFVGEGLKLPGNWEKAGLLTVQRFDAEDGWLVAAWNKED